MHGFFACGYLRDRACDGLYNNRGLDPGLDFSSAVYRHLFECQYLLHFALCIVLRTDIVSMQLYTYYRYGFVTVDLNSILWSPDTPEVEGTKSTCSIANSDIAGIGVVTSFLIAGLMTTFASITAAVLESRINDGGPILFPGFLHRWLGRHMNDVKRERCRFWRDILERLILNLADQQLITGISLLIIAYIVQPWPLSPMGQNWPSRLSLVIYLSCLSSSSHLACMLTLHRYLKGHAGLAKLRIFFIILFAMVLAISIGLGQTFSVVGYVQYQILLRVNSDTAYNLSLYIGGALLYGLPPLIALHVYWTAVMQLWPSARHCIERIIRHFYRRYGRKVVPRKVLTMILGPKSLSKFTSAVKRIFWWSLFLNPPMIFALQILFAKISIAFILMQKFAGPSLEEVSKYEVMCQGLNNPAENQWGFGQMLSMFVLVLPVLAAIETYLGKLIQYPLVFAIIDTTSNYRRKNKAPRKDGIFGRSCEIDSRHSTPITCWVYHRSSQSPDTEPA